jgi:hypothetical protein
MESCLPLFRKQTLIRRAHRAPDGSESRSNEREVHPYKYRSAPPVIVEEPAPIVSETVVVRRPVIVARPPVVVDKYPVYAAPRVYAAPHVYAYAAPVWRDDGAIDVTSAAVGKVWDM